MVWNMGNARKNIQQNFQVKLPPQHVILYTFLKTLLNVCFGGFNYSICHV